jgi:hypothetical protein
VRGLPSRDFFATLISDKREIVLSSIIYLSASGTDNGQAFAKSLRRETAAACPLGTRASHPAPRDSRIAGPAFWAG